jgi:hypothetical protein
VRGGQHLYPDTSQSFPVIDCIESRSCAEGEKPGINCDGNPAGRELLHPAVEIAELRFASLRHHIAFTAQGSEGARETNETQGGQGNFSVFECMGEGVK